MKSSDISNQKPLPQDLVHTRTKSFEALLTDVRRIIEDGLRKAYQEVDMVMVNTYL